MLTLQVTEITKSSVQTALTRMTPSVRAYAERYFNGGTSYNSRLHSHMCRHIRKSA